MNKQRKKVTKKVKKAMKDENHEPNERFRAPDPGQPGVTISGRKLTKEEIDWIEGRTDVRSGQKPAAKKKAK